MKAPVAPVKPPRRHRVAKWIPGADADVVISKSQARQFTGGLLKIAARIQDLPPDLARNHGHYLHGLPQDLTGDQHFEQAGFIALLK